MAVNTELTTDLNSVIANAVNARIEAQVLAALSGDEVIGQYVMAALNQQVEVPKQGSIYDKVKTTFLKATIDRAMQSAVKSAVASVLAEETAAIEDAVRKELRRNVATLAQTLVGSVSKATESPYGVTVELKYPSR